jgi:hypothetical protein
MRVTVLADLAADVGSFGEDRLSQLPVLVTRGSDRPAQQKSTIERH